MKINLLTIFTLIFTMFLPENNLYGDTPPNSVYLYKGNDGKDNWNKNTPRKKDRDNSCAFWSLLQKEVCLYLSTYSQEADIYIQDKRNRTVFKQSVGASDTMLEISTAGLRPGEYYIYILTDDEMWYGSFEI